MPYVLPLALERNPATQGPEIGGDVGLPFGLDPQRFPILVTHWFGAPPFVLGENGEPEPVKSRPHHHGGEAHHAELRQA